MCATTDFILEIINFECERARSEKQDLTLTNTESLSVFMEVQCVCGRRLNVDDTGSASAPHPEGK